MRYSQDVIDHIRERLILSDIVGKSVSLKQKGAYHLGLCPFHTEKTPSFTVTNSKGIFYCFGCGVSGNVYDFLMKQQGVSFPEAVKVAAEKAGVTLHAENLSLEQVEREKEKNLLFEILQDVQSFYKEQLKSAEGERARSYLEKRRVTLESREEFGLGYAPVQSKVLREFLKEKGYSYDLMEQGGLIQKKKIEGEVSQGVDRFRGRLIFPILNKRGRLVGFGGRSLDKSEPKYLNSPETPIFKKGEILYGLYDIYKDLHLMKALSSGNQPLVVVEGYMDVISLAQERISSIASMGTALTEQQLLEIWRVSPEPYLCFDGDMAGKRAALRALDRGIPLLKPGYSLKFVFLPKGEDPDSLMRSGRKETFLTSLEKAFSLSDTLWDSLVEGKRLDTPELVASFKKEYREKLALIKDKNVKEAYYHDFEERFEKLLSRNTHSNKKFLKRPQEKNFSTPNTIPYSHSLPRVRNIQDRPFIQQKILLALLVKHPFLLETVGELLMRLSLAREDYSEVRDSLIIFYEEGKTLEFKTVHAYLIKKGYDLLLRDLFSPEMLALAPFLKGNISNEEAKAYWKEIWSLVEEEPTLKKDIEAAKEDFYKTMSPEAWQRLHHLQQTSDMKRNSLE